MGDNVGRSDQGNSEQHIHVPHLKMPSSLHLPHFHLHFPPHHHHHDDGHGSSEEEAHDFLKDVPKGCVAVYVGREEERQRFVIPAAHINHPLFQELLKKAEEEYGFEQKGTITIPCHVSDFQSVQDLINREHLQSQSSSLSFP